MQAPLLLTPRELNKLPATQTRVLDVTWLMPNSQRDASKEFGDVHLPNAQYMDLDQVASSHELGLPHMMPTAKTFSDACSEFPPRSCVPS